MSIHYFFGHQSSTYAFFFQEVTKAGHAQGLHTDPHAQNFKSPEYLARPCYLLQPQSGALESFLLLVVPKFAF